MALLTEAERRKGVVTASAGNHGLGVALQARRLQINAKIVMPVRAPIVKQSNVTRLGAKVILDGATYDEAVKRARIIEREEERTFVHGFDDPDVMAGQGTMALEILEAVPDVDAVIVPVGGGGLLAGVGSVFKSLRPSAKVIGVEPEHYPSMRAALDNNEPVEIEGTPTLADGLAVRRIGTQVFPIARAVLDQLISVTEDEIAQAIFILLEIEKTVVEGAGASTLAALLSGRLDLKQETVVLPLCGGNIDMTMMAHILERGMAKDGRLVWLRTYADDAPGSLANLSRIVADTRASVKDVYHNRAFGRVAPNKVEIDWVLETRGHDHIREIIDALRAQGVEVATFEQVQ
jgi:threonine dehydratase